MNSLDLTTSRVVTPKMVLGLYTPAFLNTSAAMGTVEFTGLEMMAIMASGQTLAAAPARVATMEALVLKRSSLVMPGFLGTPAGMTTISAPAREASSPSAPTKPETRPGVSIWERSAATPGVATMSYRASLVTAGFNFNSMDRGWPMPPAAPMTATLKILRKNHTCLRGHDWASNEDKKEYEELRDQLLDNRLKWSENLNEYSDKDHEIQAVHIYNEAAKLDLPSLEPGERCRSVEQKVLFEDTVVGNETSIFNNDTVIVETDETVMEKLQVEEGPSTLPVVPSFAKIESSNTLFAPVLPPTPNLRTKFDDELLPETPKIFANLRNSSFELLPPTPQLEKGPAPLVRKESDKSFLVATPTPPLLQTMLQKS